MEIRAVRGMHDLFGEEMALWSIAETRVKKVLASFGYQEIRTPVLEKKEVFSQTVGDDTDIVEKQMYTVLGDGDEKMVLRPEGTAAFVRAVVEHQLQQSGQSGRYYYYLPMFRHERPQKGRLRQFHQFGAELINDPTPGADAEIVALLHAIYSDFGVQSYEIRVNSVGCVECRPTYKTALRQYFQPHLEKLCPQCQKRFERAPMRILDCKNETCQALASQAPLITDSLCAGCQAHHTAFQSALNRLQIPFINDPHIVRGLDYYCRTAFEFTSNLLGAQSALCGGGRYDGVSQRFGAKSFPAVGFGLGMERLMMIVSDSLKASTPFPRPTAFFAAMGQAAHDQIFNWVFALRRVGIWAAMNFDVNKSLKAQLKESDRVKARFTLILGEDELKSGEVTCKNMDTGVQEKIPLNGVLPELIRRQTEEKAP